MSFVPLAEWLKPENFLKVPHRGVVVDNDDPKKLGRVKCEIEGLLDATIPIERLPFVAPFNLHGLGGTGSDGFFSVPKVGSELIVIFPYNDIYFPFYVGYFVTDNTKQSVFETNYGKRYGWTDEHGTEIIVDNQDKQLWIKHQSGSIIFIDSDGSMKIEATDLEQVVSGDYKLTTTGKCEINSTGKVSVTSSEKIELLAPSVTIP